MGFTFLVENETSAENEISFSAKNETKRKVFYHFRPKMKTGVTLPEVDFLPTGLTTWVCQSSWQEILSRCDKVVYMLLLNKQMKQHKYKMQKLCNTQLLSSTILNSSQQLRLQLAESNNLCMLTCHESRHCARLYQSNHQPQTINSFKSDCRYGCLQLIDYKAKMWILGDRCCGLGYYNEYKYVGYWV